MPELAQKPSAQAIRLVVCEQQPEDAEWLVAVLRNAGIPSRVMSGRSLEDMVTQFKSNAVDLLVWGQGFEAIELSVLARVAGENQIPLIAAVNDLDAVSFASLKMAGVDDVYLRGETDLARKTIRDWFLRSEEHRWAQRARQEQETVARSSEALLDAVADPVAYLNEGLHVKANTPYLEMLGMEAFEELEGMSLLDFVDKENAALVKDKIKSLGRGQGDPEEIEVQLSGVGEVSLVLSPSHFEGEPCLLVSVRRTISSMTLVGNPAEAGVASDVIPPAMEEWLKRDAATGLFSRQYFLERLGEAKAGSAWMIQADHQEQLLASLGVTQLDAFVRALGKAVEAAGAGTVVVSRWTSGTLGVLLDLVDEPALDWAKALQERLSQELLEVGSRSFSITASMAGLAMVESMLVEEKVASLEKLLRETLSRPQGCGYLDPSAEEKAKVREAEGRVLAVKRAIEENRLVLFFQPVVSLMENAHRYEVLVRLRGLDERLEEPAEFMPLAEKHGLAQDIDDWVVKEAIAMAKTKEANGEMIEFVLKASSASLKESSFIDRLVVRMQEAGMDASRVCVEVPVSAASTYAKEIRQLQGQAKAAGLALVMSGVTAEPSSLRLVDVVGPSWVKLSKDITIGLGASSEKQSLLKAVLSHVQPNGVKVIAGFVQDAATMTVLFTSGVEAVQGKFLAPPGPQMNFDFSQMGF